MEAKYGAAFLSLLLHGGIVFGLIFSYAPSGPRQISTLIPVMLVAAESLPDLPHPETQNTVPDETQQTGDTATPMLATISHELIAMTGAAAPMPQPVNTYRRPQPHYLVQQVDYNPSIFAQPVRTSAPAAAREAPLLLDTLSGPPSKTIPPTQPDQPARHEQRASVSTRSVCLLLDVSDGATGRALKTYPVYCDQVR